MNTIIEKIRAEIERRANGEQVYNSEDAEFGYKSCARELLSVLSDIEKSEKPTNIDFEQELYKHFGQVKDFTLGLQIAKHFYELGRQSKPKVCDGLEEEIVKFCEDFVFPLYGLDDEFGRELINKIARHFAQWQKEQLMDEWLKDRDGCFWDGVEEGKKAMREQMMKEAVEASVGRNFTGVQQVSFTVYPEKYKDGDKVKLVIVKED